MLGCDSTACAGFRPPAGSAPHSSPTPHKVSAADLRAIITPATAPACIGRPCLTSRGLVLIIVPHIRHLVFLGLCSYLCTARVSRRRQRPGDHGDVRLQALEALPVASLRAKERGLMTSVYETACGAHNRACCTAKHVGTKQPPAPRPAACSPPERDDPGRQVKARCRRNEAHTGPKRKAKSLPACAQRAG